MLKEVDLAAQVKEVIVVEAISIVMGDMAEAHREAPVERLREQAFFEVGGNEPAEIVGGCRIRSGGNSGRCSLRLMQQADSAMGRRWRPHHGQA
jgi:hypothetical protein